MTDRLRWDPGLTEVRRERRILRDPPRLALVIGSVVLMVGAFLPWAEGMVGLLPVAFGGLNGAADGLTLATLAFVLLLFAWKEDFDEPIGGIRRWAPLLIGLVCIGIWLLGRQSAELAIQHWEDDDGRGSLVPGYWLAGIGVGVVAAVSAYLTLRRRAGEPGIPLPQPRLPRRDDIEWIVGAAAGVVGAVLCGAAALALFQPVSVGIPLLFFGTIGMIVGISWGRSIGRAVRRLLG